MLIDKPINYQLRSLPYFSCVCLHFSTLVIFSSLVPIHKSSQRSRNHHNAAEDAEVHQREHTVHTHSHCVRRRSCDNSRDTGQLKGRRPQRGQCLQVLQAVSVSGTCLVERATPPHRKPLRFFLHQPRHQRTVPGACHVV